MDKNIIKNHLSKRFLSEEVSPAVKATNKAKKESGKINKDGVKAIEKDVVAYDKTLKQKDKDMGKMATNKFNYADDFQKTYHDEMEIMNGQEMLQYDSKPDSNFTERAKEAIEGTSKMGNKGGKEVGNAEETWGASSDDFGKNLVKRIKASTKKRSEQTPTLNLRGQNIQADLKDTGHRPYAIEESSNEKNNDNKPKIKESMKRLKFKTEFNGLGNALKLIPETYKVDKKEFEMTDGNESYRIRWEGNLSEGKAIVLTAADKNLVNEDISRMKALFGYKSQDTLGLVKGNSRINENKVFGDIWNKSRVLLGESEEIEGQKAKEGEWEEETKSQAPEAKKHVQGSASTDKGTKAPAPKEGNWESSTKKAPEATKHVSNETASFGGGKPKEGNWEDVTGGEKMMEIDVPAPKEGHWEDTKVPQAADAKKYVQGSVSTDKGTQAPAPKEGHWEDTKVPQAADAKKHVHLKESELDEEIDIENEEMMDENWMGDEVNEGEELPTPPTKDEEEAGQVYESEEEEEEEEEEE